jgi:tetratricopeptide (TPR) repeat protein
MKRLFFSSRRHNLRQRISQGILVTTLLLGGPANLAWAADPFRTQNPQPIDAQTEAAFRAMFEQGDYAGALDYLREAEQQNAPDPMVFAMLASLAYLEEDWDAIGDYAAKTKEAAQVLETISPLRSHLYEGIGQFLEGAHLLLSPNGSVNVSAIPTALGKLQQIYRAIDRAKQIDPADPELNLVEGYMNMLIAVNLPLVSARDAIKQLDSYAQPAYLAARGIALARRDLDQFDDAFESVNAAIEANPSENPELYYLRAQILVGQGLERENVSYLVAAQKDFRRALEKSAQLPKGSVAQIYREYCRNQNRIDQQNHACDSNKKQILATEGSWGPQILPDIPGLEAIQVESEPETQTAQE